MPAWRAGEEVAATTRNASARSAGRNLRRSQRIFFARVHARIWSVASGATTRTLAPARSRLSILSWATEPAPTTRQRRPFNFRNAGKRGIALHRLAANEVVVFLAAARDAESAALDENFGGPATRVVVRGLHET